jgi:broad specificity phosphatase PhoE
MNGDPGVACGLTATGVEQARSLGKELMEVAIELVVTSGFQRARETAREALRGRHVPELTMSDLGDPRYGDYEGCHLDDYRAWASAAGSADRPGEHGETRREIIARYARGFRTVLERPEDTILVVAHSLPVAYMVSAREGRGPGATVAMAEYAAPYRFSAAELETGVVMLERWLAAPTF